jgi:hypothetical protein
MRDDYKVGFWILIFKNLFSIYFLMKMTNKQPKIYWERRESASSGITKDHFILDVFYNCIISAYNSKRPLCFRCMVRVRWLAVCRELIFYFYKKFGFLCGQHPWLVSILHNQWSKAILGSVAARPKDSWVLTYSKRHMCIGVCPAHNR